MHSNRCIANIGISEQVLQLLFELKVEHSTTIGEDVCVCISPHHKLVVFRGNELCQKSKKRNSGYRLLYLFA